MYQARFFLGVVIAAGAAALALQAGVRPAIKTPIRAVPVPGIDGDPVYIDPDVVAGGGDPGCLAVGGVTSSFSRVADAIRGNVYRVTKSVTLTEIVMRLTVPADTELYVGIWRRLSNSTAAWVRYPSAEAPDIIILEPEAGTLAFQRSGPLEPPLPLEAGYDYLIGFAWAESTVSFARDSATYPAATPSDITFGQVRGLFGLNGGIFSEGELVNEFANTAISIFNLGAHSMQLCVAGACCTGGLANPQCRELSRTGCQRVFGDYTSEGITCADVAQAGDLCPLTKGGCCEGPDSCITINKFACDARGGTWNSGIFCSMDDELCALRGACCLDDGACAERMTESECDAADGVWAGVDGSANPILCEDTQPPCAVGACCEGDNCLERTQEQCEKVLGVFIAHGLSCEGDPCTPRGACIDSTDGCTDDLTEAQCQTEGGVYQGDGTTCEPVGACCDRDALVCQNDRTQSECADPLEWTASTRCNDLEVTCAPTGACCVPPQECQEGLTQIECAQFVGTYLGHDSVCQIESCIPTGACCDGANCNNVTQGACAEINGQYRGDGTLCATENCVVGACCNGSNCSEGAEEDCAGTYAGDNTVCNANLCTTGACCLPDCTCDDDPVTMPNGAKCLADGGQFVTQATCDEAGCGQGIVSSDPEDCRIDARQPHEPDSATPPAGLTSIVLTMTCATPAPVVTDFEIFGTPDPGITISNFAVNGDEVTLTFSGPIPPGQYTCVRHIPSGDEVCLGYLPGDVNNDSLATTDEMNPADDDVLVLTEFLKNGTPDLEMWQCDIDCSGKCTVLDIARLIDLLNGADMFEVWLGMGIGECPSVPAVGACCEGQICSDLNEDGCAAISGSFRRGTNCGDVTACAPRGACCTNGECAEAAELTCEENGGTYVGDDVPCEEGTCTPRGACCTGLICTDDSTAAECDTAGGIYIGDNSMCALDTCDIGACCTCDCADTTRAECDTTIAVFHAGETCEDLGGICELDLASSTPPSCAIDARQYQDPEMLEVPVDPKDPKAGTVPVFFGLDHLLLTMNCDEPGVTPDNFTLIVLPQQTTLDVDHINIQEATVNVVFDELLEPGRYACVEFDGTFTSKCVGYLPGDVDGNRSSEAADTFALIDHLEGDLPAPLELWQCDMDRSGTCNALDVLRHLDILVGTNGSDFWNNAQLSPCPAE